MIIAADAALGTQAPQMGPSALVSCDIYCVYLCDGRIRVRRRVGERLVGCCIQETGGNIGPSLMVWGLPMHHAKRSWWWWMKRSTSNATLASCAEISFPRLG